MEVASGTATSSSTEVNLNRVNRQARQFLGNIIRREARPRDFLFHVSWRQHIYFNVESHRRHRQYKLKVKLFHYGEYCVDWAKRRLFWQKSILHSETASPSTYFVLFFPISQEKKIECVKISYTLDNSCNIWWKVKKYMTTGKLLCWVFQRSYIFCVFRFFF